MAEDYFKPSVVTNAGLQLLKRVFSEKGTIEFTKMWLGSGKPGLNVDTESMTSIIRPVLEVPVTSSFGNPENNDTYTIIGTLDNRDGFDSFRMKEVGLYAKDEHGDEVLYAYTYMDDGEIIPHVSTVHMIRTFTIDSTISRTDDVTIKVDNTLVYATKDELLQHVNDHEAHITDIRKTLDTAGFGENNLIRNSTEPIIINPAGNETNAQAVIATGLNPDTEYTLQADAELLRGNESAIFRLFIRNTNVLNPSASGGVIIRQPDSRIVNGKLTYQFNFPEPNDKIGDNYFIVLRAGTTNSQGNTLQLTNPMLTVGTKPQPHCPAYEDNTERLDVIETLKPNVKRTVATFGGKVAGSVVENPHTTSGIISQVNLVSPTNTFAESGQAVYDAISQINSLQNAISNSVANAPVQRPLTFNIIDHLEKEYSTTIWQGHTALADKVRIAKQIVKRIACVWQGFGMTNGVARVDLRSANSLTTWGSGVVTHQNSSTQRLARVEDTQALIDTRILSDGTCRFLVATAIGQTTPTGGATLTTAFVQFEVDVETTLAHTDWSYSKAEIDKNYLPLTGGTLTGPVTFNRDTTITGGMGIITGATKNMVIRSLPGNTTNTNAAVRIGRMTFNTNWQTISAQLRFIGMETDFDARYFFSYRTNGRMGRSGWGVKCVTSSREAAISSLILHESSVTATERIVDVWFKYPANYMSGTRMIWGTVNGDYTKLNTAVQTISTLPTANTITSSWIATSPNTHDHASITGNASTATRLQTARNFSLTGDVEGAISSDLSGNVTIPTRQRRLQTTNWSTIDPRALNLRRSDTIGVWGDGNATNQPLGTTGSAWAGEIMCVNDGAGPRYIAKVYTTHRVGSMAHWLNGAWTTWDEIPATGTATVFDMRVARANQLNTSRTINGTSFNGTANITTANWGTARNITIGNLTRSVNGSANVAWTLADIGAAPVSHNHDASNIASGTFAIGRIPTGTSSTTVALGNHTHAAQTTVSGNAGTATRLQTSRQINGTNFDGTANVTTANWGTARNITIGNLTRSVNGSANVAWTLSDIGAAPASHNHDATNITSGLLPHARLPFGTGANDVARGNHTHPAQTTITGNAGTATLLATARTINGTSFNGGSNITTANWGTSRNITIGNTTRGVNGSGNVSWSLADIGAMPAVTDTGWIDLIRQSGTLAHPDAGPPQYRRIGNTVHLRGAFTNILTEQLVVATLPVGSRPPVEHSFAQNTSMAGGNAWFARWVIEPNGSIIMQRINNPHGYTNGAWFPIHTSFLID